MANLLTSAQQALITAWVDRGEFRSNDDTARQLFPERMAEARDDFVWAKPYVDAALLDIANGRIVSRQEHAARMAAVLASKKA